MPSSPAWKVLRYRLSQLMVIGVSTTLIALGVRFGFQPYGNLPAAVGFAVIGTLCLALGLRGLDIRATTNRARFETHLAQVRSQVALLAGNYGSRQGVVLSDWGNARWRDEGAEGGLSSYTRLPLLVQRGDVTWPIANESKTNTGVPIDEIVGMDATLAHLRLAGAGRLSVAEVLEDARHCLENWRAFDALFESKLLGSATARIGNLPPTVEIGWEQNPWFVPPEGRWRLGGEGFVSLTMRPQEQLDHPTMHLPGAGDTRWFVRLGSSSTWLMTGTQPVPEPRVEADIRSVISELMADSELQASFTLAVDTATQVWTRVNALRPDLTGYPYELGVCPQCDSWWVLSPPPT
jgi:hypothetical protein